MDVQQRIDEIVATVEGARAMPMSASCVVNRAELLAMLEDVREALPGSLAQAEEVLGGREQVAAEAQQEARRIIESAQAERENLVAGTEVARLAQQESERILADARREAEEIRVEADDYVDSKLANFEVVLSKTVGSVERGREKLLGSGPGAEAWGEDYAEDAPERTADPDELRHRADEYVDARLGSVAAVLHKTLEAVGRGRQKLVGHRPSDELGAHMAAQDGAGEQVPHTSDADYLAGLAEVPGAGTPEQPEPATVRPAFPSPQQQPMPGAVQQPGADDPYEAVAAAGAPMDAYYGQVPQQPIPPEAGPPGYLPQDPYYGQMPQQAYGAPYQPQQSAPLDETSFFDTGMIDLEQVARYEQAHQAQQEYPQPAYGQQQGGYGQQEYDWNAGQGYPPGYDPRYGGDGRQ
ncbi:cell division initiation protein [Streptomyces sp. TR06-5]|uniref:ATP synthase F0 subunit B n=1 Tax=unclassified Streptomyces TaxID=2593676 RepID=UPI0039A2E73B